MNYGEKAGAPQTTAPIQTSLITDSGAVYSRLVDIQQRLLRLGDALHGSEPRDVGIDKPSAPEPTPTVRRNIDNAVRMIARIEDDLTRIEHRV